ncbi:hypothetical protein DPMN_070584 [Dreissena polymorpha]|uniref:Uncharacterized protein n=1 Tax=Dreissena polymorpha TaxID=45954 RepID=A0A9D3Z3D8_DREPO|nr:hypothetical protein DPMN_070584 [Dreissena polymorpha]
MSHASTDNVILRTQRGGVEREREEREIARERERESERAREREIERRSEGSIEIHLLSLSIYSLSSLAYRFCSRALSCYLSLSLSLLSLVYLFSIRTTLSSLYSLSLLSLLERERERGFEVLV